MTRQHVILPFSHRINNFRVKIRVLTRDKFQRKKEKELRNHLRFIMEQISIPTALHTCVRIFLNDARYSVISSARLGEQQPFLISSFKVASIDTTCVQALKTHSDTLPCTHIVILSHQNIGYPALFLCTARRMDRFRYSLPPLSYATSN